MNDSIGVGLHSGGGKIFFARALSLAWALWWMFFGLASGIFEEISLRGVLMHTAVPGLIFLVSTLIAWLRERIGGIVLLCEGLTVMIVYSIIIYNRVPYSKMPIALLTLALLALPPLIAGYLFLIDSRITKK